MKSKYGMTRYACTTVTGVEVLTCLIGKSSNPGYFQIEKPPVWYFSQSNAWSDKMTFKRWYCQVFILFVHRYTSQPVALLLYNSGPHGADINDPRSQITTITLPSNSTSLRQKMDVGIICAGILRYMPLLIGSIPEDLEWRQ